MADVALGVRNSGADGTTPLALRKALGALFPNSGILSGLGVRGSSSLAYSVAAGVAVCSKGSGDGSTLAAVPAGSTPAVAANGTGHPRIDAVWVTSHDRDQGDADNHVTLGVTQGAPAASPARPAVPAYATVLAYMRLPAGATTTAQATVEARGDAATASGGTLGLLGEAALNAGRSISTGGSWSDFYTVAVTVTVPTRRFVRADYRATLAVPPGGSTGWTRVRPYLTVDGVEVAGSRRKWPAWAGPEATHSSSCATELAAGTHAVELHLAYDGGDWGLSIVDGGTGGAALSVWDEGAA
jgi:hypothetical protein